MSTDGVVPHAQVFSPSATAVPVPPLQRSAERRRMAQVKRDGALDAALKKYAKTAPEFSVAVLDRTTGELYSFRGSQKYETASVVKVQVLACLLLTAQDEERGLSDDEEGLAERMIRVSDNNATSALFERLGRQGGLTACNMRLGLAETDTSDSWGLTRTTVNDQVKLLDQLVDPKGPFNSSSRKIAFTLMSTVLEDQDWGVSAVAGTGETIMVKNGWLSRSTEDGRWIINSLGRITGDDVDVSIAVMSHNHENMPDGVRAVEKIVKLTRQHLDY